VHFDEAQADAINNFGKTVQALLDKAELLSGQATSRNETVGADEWDKYLRGAWDAYGQQTKTETAHSRQQ
jgi:hypothetical protein